MELICGKYNDVDTENYQALYLIVCVSMLTRVRSHWANNIAFNYATKFATKFASKNEMDLIPIFATKYLPLSYVQT